MADNQTIWDQRRDITYSSKVNKALDDKEKNRQRMEVRHQKERDKKQAAKLAASNSLPL